MKGSKADIESEKRARPYKKMLLTRQTSAKNRFKVGTRNGIFRRFASGRVIGVLSADIQKMLEVGLIPQAG